MPTRQQIIRQTKNQVDLIKSAFTKEGRAEDTNKSTVYAVVNKWKMSPGGYAGRAELWVVRVGREGQVKR